MVWGPRPRVLVEQSSGNVPCRVVRSPSGFKAASTSAGTKHYLATSKVAYHFGAKIHSNFARPVTEYGSFGTPESNLPNAGLREHVPKRSHERSDVVVTQSKNIGLMEAPIWNMATFA